VSALVRIVVLRGNPLHLPSFEFDHGDWDREPGIGCFDECFGSIDTDIAEAVYLIPTAPVFRDQPLESRTGNASWGSSLDTPTLPEAPNSGSLLAGGASGSDMLGRSPDPDRIRRRRGPMAGNWQLNPDCHRTDNPYAKDGQGERAIDWNSRQSSQLSEPGAFWVRL
jgi:hypothetical protein